MSALIFETREEMISWLKHTRVPIVIRGPVKCIPCRRGDLSCHGWKLVECASEDADFQ
jgi:hypothetical protein